MNAIETAQTLSISDVLEARQRIRKIVEKTPLQSSKRLSEKYGANVFIKREDMQVIRSYKIRGAFNKISLLSQANKNQVSIVCASAGNHAQGVALSCNFLGIKGRIYMPVTTPDQKIEKVKKFGGDWIDLKLTGDTYDAASQAAELYSKKNNLPFIHPFDDIEVIQGQGTVGLEILDDVHEPIDYVFVPIGGGGLCAGIVKVFSEISPHTKIIGVEPMGAPSMQKALEAGCVVELEKIDPFVDGASVKKVGAIPFEIIRTQLSASDILLVPEGKICTTIMEMYNQDAIVAEPAGALTISALDLYKEKIKGKNVVVLLSGGNNDIARMEEMKEKSLIYEGLKHYFIVTFPQRPGALRNFLNNVLGPTDDITYFQYSKKVNRDQGPAIIGIELQNRDDIHGLLQRMKDEHYAYEYINSDEKLFRMLI